MPQSTTHPVLALTVLVAILQQGLWGADHYWPGWLGPKRDGWVKDFQPPGRWPERLKNPFLSLLTTATPILIGLWLFRDKLPGPVWVTYGVMGASGRGGSALVRGPAVGRGQVASELRRSI